MGVAESHLPLGLVEKPGETPPRDSCRAWLQGAGAMGA